MSIYKQLGSNGIIGIDKKIELFNIILPVAASWIGTVIAFYFGRDNFEAATQKIQEITQKTPIDILDNISVEQIMINLKTMVSMEYAEVEKKTVKELENFLSKYNKSRLPILEKGKPSMLSI